MDVAESNFKIGSEYYPGDRIILIIVLNIIMRLF